MTLRSEPDNSLFYIDNAEQFAVSKLKKGQKVRLQGKVSNYQGCNMLVVSEVLPPIEATN